jgi:hypothetical protein
MRVDRRGPRRWGGLWLGLGVSLVALAFSACGRTPGPGPDGGSDGPVACGCQLEGDAGAVQTLTMSWDCYCGTFACPSASSFAVCSPGHFFTACGLEVFTTDTPGGPERWVFDASGAMVGVELASDSSDYTCPSDPRVRSLRLRAGHFPDPSCPMVECPCVDGGAACGPEDGGADR